MGVLLVAGKDNLFTEPSVLAKEGKELQCVISKDDTKLSISYVKSLFLTLHSAPNTLKLPTNSKLKTYNFIIFIFF
jgi:hypothetical protein